MSKKPKPASPEKRFVIVAEFMARAQRAAKPSNRKLALVQRYKARRPVLRWSEITDLINNETGCDHSPDYYRKLFARRTVN